MGYSSNYSPGGTHRYAAPASSSGTPAPPAAQRPESTGQAASAIVGAMDPVSGLLAGVITQFVANVFRRVSTRAEDHAGERLWEMIEQRLGAKAVRQLRNDQQGDWPARLRERVEAVLVEDQRFAEDAKRLLFGDGGFDEAIWQLPADDPNFANRDAEMRTIRQALTQSSSVIARAARQLLGGGGRPAVVAVIGPALIGKTELAVHAAHQLAGHYPDGCFVVDAGSSLGWSDTVTDGLVDLLRAQGTPLREIPETRELALRRYRTWFHRRRALVIIENATDEEQVRALLPPGRRCGAIVTGTDDVFRLGNERTCRLSTFTRSAAFDMLRGLDGARRRWSLTRSSDVPSRDAESVLQWCGRHPAVIASVAAWISHPSMLRHSASYIAAELWKPAGDAPARVLADSRLAAGLRRQYGQIAGTSPDTAKLFRLLGLLSVPYVDRGLATALAGTSRDDTELALRELVDLGVLTMDGEHYRMAPFQQRFAEHMARTVDKATDRGAALSRAFRHLLERSDTWATAEAARALDRIGEVTRERANWIAAVGRAFAEGLYDLAWRLALRCARLFETHGYLGAWETTARIGLRAANQLDQEEARLVALAWTQVNMAAALGAKNGSEASASSFATGVQRVQELVRFGLVCVERADGEAARRCLTASTELAEACRRRPPADGTTRTDPLLATLDRDLEELHRRLEPVEDGRRRRP